MVADNPASNHADDDDHVRRGAGAAWLAASIADDATHTAELGATLAAQRRRAKAGAETGAGPTGSR